MTHDTIQRLARERAIQRLSPSQANLLTRPIRAGELDHTDCVANIIQDIEAGFVLAEMTLDEARSFRSSGAEGVAGVRGRETADAETAR
jgi:isocitrate lyase